MTQAEWIILCLCAFAALLHGLSGFGFPMMSTALLSAQYSLSLAIALVILPCLLLNLILLKADPSRGMLASITYHFKKYWPLILSSLLGSLLGVKLLLWLNEGYLKLLLGAVILFYVLDQLRHQPFQVSPTVWSMLGFGLLAGTIGGATNAMAPFLMMYLLSCKISTTEVVMVSNLNFIVSKLVQLCVLFPLLLQLNPQQQYILVWITAFALAGVWIGGKIRHRLSPQHFRSLVLGLLLIFGLHALWQSTALLQHSALLIK
ncbi:sulfite exporter TauE/SafE family protein [Acinetobacter sp. RF14B]|uniref:sulfite exporter TauE/SafE family protein n=1 Tax=Acinetobacter sp. RF14B TaxID=2650965 RepID=UPI0011671186|nr:sulfite exporter TauE/SafE family protein [Acinetobacter sp. RF14B]TQR61852.1 sulfite exporter TauE/SafE family protein [Acinetobacter sp. RF14B]